MSETAKKPSALENERGLALKDFKKVTIMPAKSIEIAEKQEGELDWHFENEKLNLENRRQKRQLRQLWNKVLIALVIAGFILSYTAIILIGCGILHFENNAFAVPSVVAAGIVETYGLAKLAIKYFFSEDGDSLKP